MPPPQVIPIEWAVPAAQLTGVTKRGGLLKKAGNVFGCEIPSAVRPTDARECACASARARVRARARARA